MSRGIVVFAHGSRIKTANDAVRRVAADLSRLAASIPVEPAFLELGRPDLEGAVVSLMQRGVTEVVVIPYFLTTGIHLERDLPDLIAAVCRAHPGVQIRSTPPLDGHAALVQVLLDRAKEAGLAE